MPSRLIPIATILVVFLASTAAAQTTETAELTVTSPPAAEPEAPPAETAGVETEPDQEVLRGLSRLLRAHPTELSQILRLDPALLANAEFLSRYPEVAAFVQANPRVGRNPRLYVSRADLPSVYQRPVETAGAAIAEGIAIMGTVLIIVFSVMWLIRTIIEQRRWNRLARVQAEVHGKLLDRFTSSEDLLRYMQSPAGTRFLESAPIPVRAERRGPSSVPAASMLWSLQIGVVIAVGSLGLLLISGLVTEGARDVAAMGIVGLCVGIGFAASGVISSIVSKRLGLWPADEAGPAGE